MIRRRTALSVSAVALLSASPLLAACGSAPHPGSAAVVDGERITLSQLQAQVEDVRVAQRGSAQPAQLIQNSGQLTRATLGSMIFNRVLNRAAEDAGVTVSRGDVQKARAEMVKQAGSEDRLNAQWLQQYAIAPGQVDEAIHNQVAMDKLAQALGADRNSPQGVQKLVTALGAASRELGVEVNPRFGAWDSKKVQLGDAKTPWLRAAPKEKSQA
ncbi:SurA N-terminal domain-containing protein [Streptomyces sp. NPDC051776]|uniref:SurA N-terminal domain-containing protein n=1 Tax=Streptomyces sp. NPDC051776 TaxID=3155414 RepID=UPI003421C1AD